MKYAIRYTRIENPVIYVPIRHLYICRDISTTIEDSLQIRLFLQNKANFPDDQMNVTSFYAADYANIANWKVRKNKPNTKPNKANFRKAKMNVTTFLTKEYENISNCSLAENKPNTKPIQTQTKPTSEAKKCCSPAFCCGISKEKMIFYNLINGKSQFERAW